MMRASTTEQPISAEQRRASRWARRRLGALITAASLSLATSAMGQGQGPGQGSDTSCVVNDLRCSASGLDSGASQCSSYQTCFDSETESTYYIADGRRFDCEGLECARASLELDAFCCPVVDNDAGAGRRRVNSGGGCALSSPASSAGSFSIAGLGLLALLLLRRRASR